MSVLLNPVIVSVFLMVLLCLAKVNVFLSIVLASLVCGLLGGASLTETLDVFVDGMGGNNTIVLSMLLFGVVVEAIQRCGLGTVLAPCLSRLAAGRRWMLFLAVFVFSVLAESVLMLGPAFVPIAIPPLLGYANEQKIDRRCIAAVTVGGLQTGYACIPLGFGLAFHQTVQRALEENGLTVELTLIWKSVWPFGLALVLGSVIAQVIYRKPRVYGTAAAPQVPETEECLPGFERRHWATLAVAGVTIVLQFLTGSMPLGALVGIGLLLLLRVVPWKEFGAVCGKGVGGFGSIAFVLMAAAGFAAVFREYGQIDTLVAETASLIGDNVWAGALIMLLLGWLVTVGIGSGFAAVPIVSAILVPMCLRMGFGGEQAVLLVAAAAALGDGMTPASSQTLLPTAALALDGQHDHIRDTCVPVFLCYLFPVTTVVVLATVG